MTNRQPSEEDNTATTAITELVRRYFQARWNDKDFAIVDELTPTANAPEHKAWLKAQHDALGDTHLTIEELIADGDRVALRWQLTAIHQGEYLGVAPTGEPVTFHGLALLRVEDGQIVSDVAYGDHLQVLLHRGRPG
jgi:predicted ester cyclase